MICSPTSRTVEGGKVERWWVFLRPAEPKAWRSALQTTAHLRQADDSSPTHACVPRTCAARCNVVTTSGVIRKQARDYGTAEKSVPNRRSQRVIAIVRSAADRRQQLYPNKTRCGNEKTSSGTQPAWREVRPRSTSPFNNNEKALIRGYAEHPTGLSAERFFGARLGHLVRHRNGWLLSGRKSMVVSLRIFR